MTSIINNQVEAKIHEAKMTALANHLEILVTDVTRDKYDIDLYNANGNAYWVLDESEATDMCRERILESLWAFKAEFIAKHTMPRLDYKAQQALAKMQEELCEDANDLVLTMIDNVDDFVKHAITLDGRGHFLNGFDGEEFQEGEYFIYQE